MQETPLRACTLTSRDSYLTVYSGGDTTLTPDSGPDIDLFAVELVVNGCIPADRLTSNEFAAALSEMVSRKLSIRTTAQRLQVDPRQVVRWRKALLAGKTVTIREPRTRKDS